MKTMEAQRTLKVLLIEDYKLTRMGLKSSLEEFEGISVIGESEDAENGILLIQQLLISQEITG